MGTTSKERGRTSWKQLSEEAHADRRREKRVNLAFAIELFGFDSSNRYFTEHAVTVNVSESGCHFRLKHQLKLRTVVAIRVVLPEAANATPRKPALFLICWVKRAGDFWAVGASSLHPESIWPTDFPDPPVVVA